MPRLQLKLLGGFDARLPSGAALQITTRKTRALLAYLVLPAGRAQTREKLASIFWSDRGDKQAQASLRQSLVELSRAFDAIQPSPLIKHQDAIAIDPGAVEVDALTFERLAASKDPEDLQDAAMLYAGELLEGIGIRDPAFEEWLLFERQRLHDLAVSVLTRLGNATAGLSGIPAARRLLELDPLQEEAHRSIMRRYAEAGETGLALRQYELCREILRRELNAAPSEETEALHREIRLHSKDLLALRGTETARTSPTDTSRYKPSIAVLPFKNFGGDPAQQYFCDGITQDVTTELSRFRSLRVVGRHSSFREQFPDVIEVGRKLDVEYVVDGTVIKVGDHVRITVRLSETGSGSQLWAERYDRELQNTFAVQDEVARTIVATLSGRLEDAGAERARRKPAGSLAAYDCLFRAIELHNRMTEVDEPRASEMLLKALDLDLEFALAHAWLAVSYMVDWFEYGSREAFDKALAVARRAVLLDDDDGRCHATLGYVCTYHKLFEQAAYHVERAVTLTPNDFRVISERGMLLAYLGRAEEAVDRAAGINAALERRIAILQRPAHQHEEESHDNNNQRGSRQFTRVERQPVPPCFVHCRQVPSLS